MMVIGYASASGRQPRLSWPAL